MSRFFFAGLLLLITSLSFAQGNRQTQWVDSVFATLSTSEKIGQLFMVTTGSTISIDDVKTINDFVKSGKIGSIYIKRSSPARFVKRINKLQSLAKVGLLTAADVTEGLSYAFDSTMHFYDSSVWRAIVDDSLKKNLASEISRQVKMLKVHLNVKETQNSVAGLKFLDTRGLPLPPKAKKGEVERLALIGGADLILAPVDNVDPVLKAVTKSLRKNKLLSAHIDSAVRKVLGLKYATCRSQNQVNLDNLMLRLHTPDAALLKLQLAEDAVTVVKNDSSLLPIKTLDDKTFASVSVGLSESNEFTKYLSRYAWFRHHSLMSDADTTALREKLDGKDLIVVGLFVQANESLKKFVLNLSRTHQLVICNFTFPSQLGFFEQKPTLVEGFSTENGLPQVAAEIIFGGLEAKLLVRPTDSLAAREPLRTKSMNRFSYELPESAGMDSNTLDRIERIAEEAISNGATPGIHVLVAKDGKVVYEKSFGTLMYDKKAPYTDETIFDLASITKVSATLQAVMYMQEKGLIDINKKASVYLPELKESNKVDFTIKDILTHQGGLWPFLPFWAETVKDTAVWKKYYSKTESEEYPFPVSENLFAVKSMKDSLWHWIVKARIRDKTGRTNYDYRYSDMGFYIMQHLAEKLLGMPQEDFLQKNIYRRIGAYTTGYLPLRKFPATQIAPTENDTLFRKSLLIGYVHDQGAAMHGGIAGHAGLFSNANDLAKLGQMWLNKGTYGGVTIFKPETIELFTSKQFETSRRGLGWDKPTQSDWNGPTSMYCSPKTFGHTGFTGTSIWVDPEFNLVFVFLSNRVNPDMNNNKILTSNIRPRIQDVVYHSIFEYCRNHKAPLKPNELKSGLTVKP